MSRGRNKPKQWYYRRQSLDLQGPAHISLGQLQQLEKLGLGQQPWKALRVMVEENRAEVNFELVRRLAEREEIDWTCIL